MKNLFTFLFTILIVVPAFAQTTGGPDAYGYQWYNSNDPNGPTYQWVDITAVGTQVTGLGDDNAVGPINMGMNFHYYWSDYNQVKIGSNGWISFNNPGNVAHCFPTIPTQGGVADNLLAPMMCDLNLAGSTNPGEVWYYNDVANNRFIVSYINVPYWKNANPDYAGSNTFQVVLSAADSSITYNYQTADFANFSNTANCASDLVVGMENITGNIGLMVYQDVVPSSNFSIKFEYPHPVTFQVQDASPAWSLNAESKGTFFSMAGTIDFSTGISNKGNTPLSAATTVNVEIRSLNNSLVYANNQTVAAGLASGVTDTISFSIPPLPPDQYTVRTITYNSGDINPSNNTLTAEINVVDLFSGPATLTYATQSPPDGVISWQGGGGGAIHIEPPLYPLTLDSVSLFLAQGTFNPSNHGSVVLNIYADDGTNGLPGTLLSSWFDSYAGDPLNNWKTIVLPSPVTISAGGVYIGWEVAPSDSIVVGTETAGPISRRTYEFVGGGWAPFRNGEATDFLINGHFTNTCITFNATATSEDELVGNDGSIDLTVSGGIPPYTFVWNNGAGTNEDPTGLTAGEYTVFIADSVGCTDTLSVVVGSRVGIADDILRAQILIYPNPNNGTFSVDAMNFKEGFRLELYNTVGQLMAGQQISGGVVTTLHMAGLSEGIYIVKLIAGSSQSTRKLIIR
ncbi:MAG: T9SS type A sorting domain-containing protein [Bacteroidia bacterium]